MSHLVKRRRGSTTAINNFTPAQGEIIVDTTTFNLSVGDGSTLSGHYIPTDDDIISGKFIHATSGGSPNEITLTSFKPPVVLQSLMRCEFRVAENNTGAVTAAWGNSGIHQVKKVSGDTKVDLAADDLVKGDLVAFVFDGIDWLYSKLDGTPTGSTVSGSLLDFCFASATTEAGVLVESYNISAVVHSTSYSYFYYDNLAVIDGDQVYFAGSPADTDYYVGAISNPTTSISVYQRNVLSETNYQVLDGNFMIATNPNNIVTSFMTKSAHRVNNCDVKSHIGVAVYKDGSTGTLDVSKKGYMCDVITNSLFSDNTVDRCYIVPRGTFTKQMNLEKYEVIYNVD